MKIFFFWIKIYAIGMLLLGNTVPLTASATPHKQYVIADNQRITPYKKRPTQSNIRRGGAIILAILMPPLGVAAWQDWVITRRFWIALCLILLGFFPAVIFALYVVTK